MTNNFTLIIPTQDRPKFLERLFHYYDNLEINFIIIILDSSKVPFLNSPVSDIFIYEHCPGMEFIEKIDLALKKIDTSFCALCADDDFMIPSGIESCCDFLYHNSDYVSAQGRVVRFENLDSILYTRDEYKAIDITHEDYKDRIFYGMITNYTQTFYSVHQTESLRSIFSHAVGINYSLIELFVTFSTHLHGKHKVISDFYYAREENPISEGKSTVGVEVIVVHQKVKYKQDYEKFIKKLYEIMKEYDGKYNKKENFHINIINNYLLNFDINIFSTKKNSYIYSAIKNLLRPYYLKFIFFSKKVMNKNNMQGGQSVEQLKKNKECHFFKGDDGAMQELEKIDFFIKCHDIKCR